jgi:dTDP-4-dehydrorhamnose 3,5-epimerase
METYSTKDFAAFGIDNVFVQMNHSFTEQKGTIRGIHFQNKPMAQAKLVRVIRGAVMDVAVDLRKGSSSYLRWVDITLSADNKRMLFIPRGFGHAFLTLTDNVEFQYSVDGFHSPHHDRSIRYDDPPIGIDWPFSDAVLSVKDLSAPLAKESDCNFVWGDV